MLSSTLPARSELGLFPGTAPHSTPIEDGKRPNSALQHRCRRMVRLDEEVKYWARRKPEAGNGLHPAALWICLVSFLPHHLNIIIKT